MSTRGKLLLAFESRPGKTLSGTTLAKRFEITRASVSKQMTLLRHAGLPIESAPRKGYRFIGAPDFSLMKLDGSSDLANWATLHYELSTPSTQGLAKSGAVAGLPGGHVWVAEIQTQGRGRLDRRWESGFGGLWMSLLLRPSLPAAKVPPVTLVAAMNLQAAIQEITGVEAHLKWPNDLVVRVGGQWKKIAGLLTEMSGEVDRTDWVVLGMGLNVNNNLPDTLKPIAVALNELTGKTISRARLLEGFLRRFQLAYRRLQKDGFEVFRADYWRFHRDPGESVRIQTSQGPIEGMARGVDASGALIVESRRQIYHLMEGEIVS